jgi:hypothetical protein
MSSYVTERTFFSCFFLLWANQKIRSFELGRARCKYLQGRIDSKKNSEKKKKTDSHRKLSRNIDGIQRKNRAKKKKETKPKQNKPKQEEIPRAIKTSPNKKKP